MTGSIAGQYLGIPKYVAGNDLTAALNWIRFEEEPAQQVDLWKYIGSLPASQPTYAADPHLFASPTVRAFAEAGKEAYATPFIGAWGNLEVDFATACQSVATAAAAGHNTNAAVGLALDKANKEFQTALGQTVKI